MKKIQTHRYSLNYKKLKMQICRFRSGPVSKISCNFRRLPKKT
jgi:hypothetical protein